MEAELLNTSERRGAALSEVMIGLALFAMFSLAVMGVLIQSARLDAQEQENTQLTALAQRLVEERIDTAREYQGYHSLSGVSVSPTSDPHFLYTADIIDVSEGLKKLTVTIYHADPDNPTVVDSSRARGGESITLSVVVGEPNP